MNALEVNAANAIIRVLRQSEVLDKIPPKIWNEKAAMSRPSASVKATQGEEIVYQNGIYRIACSVDLTCLAKKDRIDEFTEQARRYLTEKSGVQNELCDGHFHCFALEAGGSSNSNTGELRERSLNFSLVGFDLDRFA